MTTIAYKDGFLAGDSLCCQNGVRLGYRSKISHLANGSLYGACGSTADAIQVVEWLENGSKANDRPKVDGNFSALLVELNGQVWFYDCSLTPIEFDAPFFAEGSGKELALGAMAAGASAQRAVEIAAEWDSKTGGPVTQLTLHKAIPPKFKTAGRSRHEALEQQIDDPGALSTECWSLKSRVAAT